MIFWFVLHQGKMNKKQKIVTVVSLSKTEPTKIKKNNNQQQLSLLWKYNRNETHTKQINKSRNPLYRRS